MTTAPPADGLHVVIPIDQSLLDGLTKKQRREVQEEVANAAAMTAMRAITRRLGPDPVWDK